VFGTCVVIAVKYHEDQFPYSMAYYAIVLGVTPIELCAMERFVLKSLNFSVYVDQAHYEMAISSLASLESCSPLSPNSVLASSLLATSLLASSHSSQSQVQVLT
jgi:hypothetical protein